MTRVLNNMDRVKDLAELLEEVPRVVAAAERRGTSNAAEAWQIATALADVEESVEKLFGDLVPRLLSGSIDDETIDDILNDVGEEYRHILYHILDTKTFDYIVPTD